MPGRVALFSLHSSPLADPGSPDVGGMNLYVRRLALGLAARGMRVDVFTRRTDNRSPERVPLAPGADLIHLNAGPPRPIPKRELPLHIPAMTCAAADFLQRTGHRYDVLNSHYWISGLVAEHLRFSVGSSAPIVHMFHTLAKTKELYSGAPDPSDSALRAGAERRLLRRVDAIVGCTHAEQDELERLYGREPRLFRVIPPGIDLDTFYPRDRTSTRESLGLHARHVLLYVGRFTPLKGLDVLLRAVARFPASVLADTTLVLVGGGRDRQAPDVRRYRHLIQDLGLDRAVDMRGYVEHSSLPLYYSAADVCVVPSFHETFGMAATEAMACEATVVASRAGGLVHTIANGSTGYLTPPGNIDALKDRLVNILRSGHDRDMGRRARNAVLALTWDSTIDRTVELFDDAIFLANRPPVAAGSRRA